MSSQAINGVIEIDRRFSNALDLIDFAVHGMNGNISRIDLQITQGIDEDGLITPSDIIQWDRQGLVQCKAYPSVSAIISKQGLDDVKHETVYYGNLKDRGKKGIVRIYDKGVDEGLVSNWLTRFELEEKREKAMVTAYSLLEGLTIEQAFVNRFTIEHPQWLALVNATPSAIPRRTKPDEDNIDKRWLWAETLKGAFGRLISDSYLRGDDGISRFTKWASDVLVIADNEYRASQDDGMLDI
jgi:hypothetical protein